MFRDRLMACFDLVKVVLSLSSVHINVVIFESR